MTARLNPGYYVIADPSYLVPSDEWDDWMDQWYTTKKGTFETEIAGRRGIVWHTEGDGVFPVYANSKQIGQAAVDSGLLVMISAAIMEDEHLNTEVERLLGENAITLVNFGGGSPTYQRDPGIGFSMRIGDVIIDDDLPNTLELEKSTVGGRELDDDLSDGDDEDVDDESESDDEYESDEYDELESDDDYLGD